MIDEDFVSKPYLRIGPRATHPYNYKNNLLWECHNYSRSGGSLQQVENKSKWWNTFSSSISFKAFNGVIVWNQIFWWHVCGFVLMEQIGEKKNLLQIGQLSKKEWIQIRHNYENKLIIHITITEIKMKIYKRTSVQSLEELNIHTVYLYLWR